MDTVRTFVYMFVMLGVAVPQAVSGIQQESGTLHQPCPASSSGLRGRANLQISQGWSTWGVNSPQHSNYKQVYGEEGYHLLTSVDYSRYTCLLTYLLIDWFDTPRWLVSKICMDLNYFTV